MNFTHNGSAYSTRGWDWPKFIFCNMVALVLFATFSGTPLVRFGNGSMKLPIYS